MTGILYLIIGLILGFSGAYFYFKSKQGPGISVDEKEKLQQLINNAEIEKAVFEQRVKNFEEDVKKTNAEKNSLNSELNEERNKVSMLNSRIAASIERFNAQEENHKKLTTELENINKKYTTEFENIANKILEDKAQKFTDQNKNNLNIILDPLKLRIKEFETKVEDTYKSESKERIQLQTEIKNLVELNHKISLEANNLASALKGDNKKQGNWGEIFLEKVLERSGLEKDVMYKTQVTTSNIEGNIIKPDVVIYLPDKKNIIIDSKVSLLAYNNFANAENDSDRELYLKQHIDSIKMHVKGLSEKNYQTSLNFSTPDFVLLFLPIESSFSIAVQHDPEVFNYAWDKKIVIVSPTTLLATLRTVASIWKQEQQTRNAIEIARIGGSLYDGFVRFLEEMKTIEKHIIASQNAYTDAFKKLSTGKGNLIVTAQKIKKLGATPSKSIDSNLLDEANESEDLLNEE